VASLLNGSSRPNPHDLPNGGKAGWNRVGHALPAGLAAIGLVGLGFAMSAVVPGASPDRVGPRAQGQSQDQRQLQDQPQPREQTQPQQEPQQEAQEELQPEPELGPVRVADAAAAAEPPPATGTAPDAVAESAPLTGPDALHVLGSAIDAFEPEARAAAPIAVEDDAARREAARALPAGSTGPSKPEPRRQAVRAKARRAVKVANAQPAAPRRETAPRREAAPHERANRARPAETPRDEAQALPSELRLGN
jgi:hypothetical protein